MDDIRATLVDDFGRQYERFGHSELLGRVMGLLLGAVEPLAEEEIARALQVSKSPVNQITRRLEELNLVRRVRFQGDRKYYYELADDAFLKAATNLYRLYEENLQIADSNLRAMLDRFESGEGPEKDADRVVCERLIQMREFHARMIESYRNFIEDWRSMRQLLLPVEEYVAELGPPPVPSLPVR